MWNYHHNRVDEARMWRGKLSLCKQKALNLLLQTSHGGLRYRGIVDALYALLQLPGMRSGLELGNVHKYLALHYPEHIERYLRHIATVWGTILGNRPELIPLIDYPTIELLTHRVPSDPEDSHLITAMVSSHQVFFYIQDPALRDEILSNIMSLDVVIPSLATFHSNMRYFSIGARILQRFTVDNSRFETTFRVYLSNGCIILC